MQNIQAELKVTHNKGHDEVIKELLITDVLLLTSIYEGSPNLVKEAMACNCPIVSTDVGDIRWLFGNEPGHFISTFEPQDVAKKIKMAIQFSDEHFKTEGRKRIEELGLDSKLIAEKIFELLNRKNEQQSKILNIQNINALLD